MNETAKERILFRMNSALKQASSSTGKEIECPLKNWTLQEKIDRLKSNLESVRSEVYVVTKNEWKVRLAECLKTKQVNSLLYSPYVELGADVVDALSGTADVELELVAYETPVEAFKNR